MSKDLIPIISNDISVHPIGKKDFFIHQKVYDHRIKISYELYEFIKLIDNEKTLEEIVLEYNTKFNYNITCEFSYNFLYNKLAKYGIIITDNIKIKPNTKPDYLKLSFILINQKYVSKVTKHLKFLFIPIIIKVFISISVLAIFFSFFMYSDEIFNTKLSSRQWVLLFVLSFIGVTFHEFGHASSAHYFGAKHGGIGGGFYLFMPVYFADVTDIWKLPKTQRIIVSLAGIYFELIYSFFLILLSLIFNIKLLLVLSCLISISILYNLNPFVRSDGYWVLSDLLEKPNLMKHGIIKIKELFRSKKTWKRIDYFVLIYGLISLSFILLFLYYVLIKNPDSILYFPKNVKQFILNLFAENAHFSLTELGKLFIPILFFYLVFRAVKGIYIRHRHKQKLTR